MVNVFNITLMQLGSITGNFNLNMMLKIEFLKKTLMDLYRTSRAFISPTHKRTEGRAPVWGSEFTIKVAHYRGVQQKPQLG